MMRRYFYDSGPLMSRLIQKNTFLRKHEDEHFRMTILAAKRLNPQKTFSDLHQTVLDMTISQQKAYSNNYYLQCLFKQFSNFVKALKCKPMIIDSSRSNPNIKDIVDPNKFPIWDLKQTSPVYKSNWNHLMGELRHHLGFQLLVRQSKVQHFQGGKGVKLMLSKNKDKIQPGQFIGFVPGYIYQHYESYQRIRLKKIKQYEKMPQHLHFPSGKILELGDVPFAQFDFDKGRYKQKDQQILNKNVDPTYLNPYAIGHMINHPPPGQQENVCFSQLTLDFNFFPKYWLKFLPYVNGYDNRIKQIRLFGIFALKQIKDNEQLFVNYLQNHIYPIQNIPEWYIEPVRSSPHFKYFQKGEYQMPGRQYWKWMQLKAMKRNQQLFKQYQKQVKFRPDKVVYQDKDSVIRIMSVRKYEQQNEFK